MSYHEKLYDLDKEEYCSFCEVKEFIKRYTDEWKTFDDFKLSEEQLKTKLKNYMLHCEYNCKDKCDIIQDFSNIKLFLFKDEA